MLSCSAVTGKHGHWYIGRAPDVPLTLQLRVRKAMAILAKLHRGCAEEATTLTATEAEKSTVAVWCVHTLDEQFCSARMHH